MGEVWWEGFAERALVEDRLMVKVAIMTSSSAMAERPRELGDFKKARGVNGGTNNHPLRIRTSVSAAVDRPASYGNQQFLLLGLAATYICRQWV